MVKRIDYTLELIEAARSVLLEIMRVLGEYQDEIVIVGGWVPELLLSQAAEEHIGSIDVDLALNHRRLDEVGYKTILELLLARGYVQAKHQPFIFYRTVNVGDHEIEVEIDFLAGEYRGTGKSRRTQRVQDMRPRKARGIDLVFDSPEKIAITGRLPGGGDDFYGNSGSLNPSISCNESDGDEISSQRKRCLGYLLLCSQFSRGNRCSYSRISSISWPWFS
jgi:hypothetical protein